MDIARLSNLKPVLVSLALAFALTVPLHGYGWNPPFKQKYDEHEFLAACRQGRLDIVEHWLGTKGFDPNEEFPTITGYKVSGLVVAALKGHTDITRALLDSGANPNISPTNTGYIPLAHASSRGHKDIVQLLLDHNADPNLIESQSGANALVVAINNGETDIVEMLLDKGADPNTIYDSSPIFPPIYLAIHHGQTPIVKLLLEHGADPNLRFNNESSPLTLACSRGEVLTAQALMDKGADVNWVNSDGTTPLYHASQNGFHVLVKALLDNGADSSLSGYYYLCMKMTPLRIAKLEKPAFRFLNPVHYDYYTKVINLLSHQKRSVPLPAQQHSEPDSAYGTPEHSVEDEDMSSENVEVLGTALQQVTFQKGAKN